LTTCSILSTLRNRRPEYSAFVLDNFSSSVCSNYCGDGALWVCLSVANCWYKQLTKDRILNVISVRWFGIAEFYLSIFKVILICGCMAFTFVTMVGGNPLHDRYGFRYWKDPVGATTLEYMYNANIPKGAFIEYGAPGNTGRFLGVLACVIQATFS